MATELAPETRAERRRLQTRSALLRAARELLSERSVGEVTIQQITDAADVAKGSFYNHFESREDLQHAAAAAVIEEIGAANDRDVALQEGDPARIIAASLHSTLRTCLADPILGGFLLNNADMSDFGAALLVRGKRDVRRGLDAGRFEVEDLEMLMIAIAGAGQSILRARLRAELPATAETKFVALVLRILGVEASEANEIATEVAQTFQEKTS